MAGSIFSGIFIFPHSSVIEKGMNTYLKYLSMPILASSCSSLQQYFIKVNMTTVCHVFIFFTAVSKTCIHIQLKTFMPYHIRLNFLANHAVKRFQCVNISRLNISNIPADSVCRPIPSLNSQQFRNNIIRKPLSDRSGRDTANNRIWRNILCNYSSCTYNSPVSNLYS